MLAWELGLPDAHGWEIESYERLRKQGAAPESVRVPILLPVNDRAYGVLQRLYMITEADGMTGVWRLNYPALKDFMAQAGASVVDREKIINAWAALRRRQAESINKREQVRDSDWDEKKRRFFSAS